MKTDEILERLDTLGKMLYEKCGTDSYEARCYLHDTKELIKKGQTLPIDGVSKNEARNDPNQYICNCAKVRQTRELKTGLSIEYWKEDKGGDWYCTIHDKQA